MEGRRAWAQMKLPYRLREFYHRTANGCDSALNRRSAEEKQPR